MYKRDHVGFRRSTLCDMMEGGGPCVALGLLHTQMFGFILQKFQAETETGSRQGRNFLSAYQLTYLESSLVASSYLLFHSFIQEQFSSSAGYL